MNKEILAFRRFIFSKEIREYENNINVLKGKIEQVTKNPETDKINSIQLFSNLILLKNQYFTMSRLFFAFLARRISIKDTSQTLAKVHKIHNLGNNVRMIFLSEAYGFTHDELSTIIEECLKKAVVEKSIVRL